MRGSDGCPEDSLELVSQYFKQGYNNLEILEFLKLHGINISLSTKKRRLTSYKDYQEKVSSLMIN